MARLLTVELLSIVLILVLITIFTYIDTREFMIEGFLNSNSESNGDSSNKCKLILFHAHWCGHCKKMKPDWNRVKNEFPDRCEEYESEVITEEQRSKYNIKGYPTILVLRGEKIEEYNGERSYMGFKELLMNN